jgi:hypothetical protein
MWHGTPTLDLNLEYSKKDERVREEDELNMARKLVVNEMLASDLTITSSRIAKILEKLRMAPETRLKIKTEKRTSKSRLC